MQTSVTPELRKAFAPGGVLRASINLGNPVLAARDGDSGRPIGVSVDLANALSKSLGLPIELLTFNSAAELVDAVANGGADFGFFAIDPLRGEHIHFTAPYALIEGCYMVRKASPLRSAGDVDTAGIRIAASKGSAYDLFLTRELKHATLVRAPNPAAVADMFIDQNLKVAAGVRKQLEADAHRIGGLRLLQGHFMVIQQAMGLPKSKGQDAANFLTRFVEEMKAVAFVADALKRHNIESASVAP